MGPVTGWITGFSCGHKSTSARMSVLDIEQGANHLVSASPLASQATWASVAMGLVASCASGALRRLAQLFRLLYSPLIAIPFCYLAALIRGGVYEPTLKVKPENSSSTTIYTKGGSFMTILRVGGKEKRLLLSNQELYHGSNDSSLVSISRSNGDENTFRRVLGEAKEEQGWEPVQDAGTIQTEDSVLYFTGLDPLHTEEEGCHRFEVDGETRYFGRALFQKEASRGVSGFINDLAKRFLGCSPIVPSRFWPSVTKAIPKISDHLSNVIRISLVVASIALFWLGKPWMALGVLSSMSYEFLRLDLSVLSPKVSVFIERWMPSVTSFALLITGGVFTKIMSAISLLLENPSTKLQIHHLISRYLRKISTKCYGEVIAPVFLPREELESRHFQTLLKNISTFPVLEQFDQPYSRPRVISGDQILQILNMNSSQFEIAPPLFTTDFSIQLDPPRSRDFDGLMREGNALRRTWEEGEFNVVWTKVRDDDRFQNYIDKEAQNEQGSLDEKVDVLAQRAGQTRQTFVVNWVLEQLKMFTQHLKQERGSVGKAYLLLEIERDVSTTIPFLLSSKSSPQDKSSALLILAVEGGNYCNLGRRRASKAALDIFLAPLKEQAIQNLPQEERPLRQFLWGFQFLRNQLLDEGFRRLTQIFQQGDFSSSANDIHLHQELRRVCNRLTYPMDEEEKREFSISHLFVSELLVPFIMAAIQSDRERRSHRSQNENMEFLLSQAVQRSEIVSFVLHQLRQLNKEDKRRVLEELGGSALSDQSSDQDKDEVFLSQYDKWSRLFLYFGGVYRIKQV